MSRIRAFAIVLGVSVLIPGLAFATGIPHQTKQGPDWQRTEEPALRPYKCLWSGIKSVVYNTTKSFIQGNEKLPVLGTVEVFRGLRRGAVDLVSGTVMGMAGSPPRNYRTPSKPNAIIEADPLLRNVADTAPAVALVTPYFVPVFVAQKVVDRSPVAPEQYKEAMKSLRRSRMERARERELRKHLGVREQKEGQGNLLRYAK